MNFTIRDALWLTVVVSLAVGWSIERSRRVAEYTSEVAKLREALGAAPDWRRRRICWSTRALCSETAKRFIRGRIMPGSCEQRDRRREPDETCRTALGGCARLH